VLWASRLALADMAEWTAPGNFNFFQK